MACASTRKHVPAVLVGVDGGAADFSAAIEALQQGEGMSARTVAGKAGKTAGKTPSGAGLGKKKKMRTA